MILLNKDVLKLAEQQFGVLARHQLCRSVTAGQVDGLVERGSLVRIHRGVYRVAGGAVLPIQEPLAAALRCRPDATLTGPLVLGYLRVDGFTDTSPYEVLLRPGRRVRASSFTTRVDPYPDRAVTRLGDVRLVAPVDALIDSGRWRDELGDRRLRLAYDWLRWRGLVDPGRVRDLLRERAGIDEGARQFLDLLGGLEGLVPESEGERDLGSLLGRFDPAPEPQVRLPNGLRLDWFFPTVALAVEYQGSVDHDTVAGRARDEQRRSKLAHDDIGVFEVRRRDLDDPDGLIRELAGVMAVRAAGRDVAPPRYRLR